VTQTTPALADALDRIVSDWIAARTRDPVTDVRVSYQVAEGTAVLAAREADRPHYAASTMKLPLVLAAYRLRDRRTLDLDSTVKIHNSFSSLAGGRFGLDQAEDSDPEVWAAMDREVPLRWLCRRAIIRSSNLATNLVFEQVGPEEIAATLAACQAAGVQVVRAIGDFAAQREGISNLVTAEGLNAILLALSAGTAADPQTCREVLDILADNEVATDVRAGLPAGTWVAHKNGWVSDVVLDAALVRPAGAKRSDGEFAISVAVSGKLPNDHSHDLIRSIAGTVWDSIVATDGAQADVVQDMVQGDMMQGDTVQGDEGGL
jgi:beta-lactamase class A